MTIVIAPDGTARCIYTETIDLHALGLLDIRRASFVEPDEGGNWWADLRPVDGPTLGPYPNRSESLAAEQRWLDQHWPREQAVR